MSSLADVVLVTLNYRWAPPGRSYMRRSIYIYIHIYIHIYIYPPIYIYIGRPCRGLWLGRSDRCTRAQRALSTSPPRLAPPTSLSRPVGLGCATHLHRDWASPLRISRWLRCRLMTSGLLRATSSSCTAWRPLGANSSRLLCVRRIRAACRRPVPPPSRRRRRRRRARESLGGECPPHVAAMPFLRISRWRGPCEDRLASMSGTLACDPTSGFPGEPQALHPRLLLCTNAASVCDGLQRQAAAQCWRQVAFVLHA